MIEKCGIVILSGGQGRRMGYVNKANLTYRGRSFAEQIMGELSELNLPFFLSGGGDENRAGLPESCFLIPDIPVGEEQKQIGPMGGIRSCFLGTSMEGLFFVPCDMPLVRAEMGRRLMKRWSPEYDAVLWKTRDGRLQPLCGFYSRSCLPILEACIGEGNYRMMDFLSRISCLVLETEREHLPDRWFLNVNDRAAFEQLEEAAIPVLAVSGRKDTGKTALLERLVHAMADRGIRTAVIKHDGHEFEADVPGTDSFRMKQAGAYGTVVYSGSKFSLVKERRDSRAEDFLPFFPEADLILLEGQKNSGCPKLEVLRSEISRAPVCDASTVLAYVTDGGWKPDMGAAEAVTAPVTFSADRLEAVLELVLRFMDSTGPGPHRGGRGEKKEAHGGRDA